MGDVNTPAKVASSQESALSVALSLLKNALEAAVDDAKGANANASVIAETVRAVLAPIEEAEKAEKEEANAKPARATHVISKRRRSSVINQPAPPPTKAAEEPLTTTKEGAAEHEFRQLSLEEFTELVSQREGHDAEHCKKLFASFDEDKSGTVDELEYLQFSLVQALSETHSRMIDLFKAWDENNDGSINAQEFAQAVHVLGYEVPASVSSAIFKKFDTDKTGSLQYAELAALCDKNKGDNLTRARLMAGPEQADHSRGGKLEAKNVNKNFVVARVHALPDVKLDASNGVSVAEQLGTLLTLNSTTVIDLFRDWDADGNGGVDIKEFRKAIKGLGYSAPKKDIDALYAELNPDGDRFIEYEELNKKLKKFMYKSHSEKTAVDCKPTGKSVKLTDDDVGKKLSLKDFTKLVQEREGYSDEHCAKIFTAFDSDNSGTVDMCEYLEYSLIEALNHTQDRVTDLFKSWDEDNSGSISEDEFALAIASLEFDVPKKVCKAVFRKFDKDKGGSLAYKELKELLDKNKGDDATRANLMAGPEQKDTSRTGKLEAKNVNTNFVCARVHALPPMTKIESQSGVSVEEQLAMLLSLHHKTIIDLFRDWDVDGNGGVDKREFRKAMKSLGYDAPRKEVDSLFDKLEGDKSGFLEYEELNKALRKFLAEANKMQAHPPDGSKPEKGPRG